MWLLNIWIQKKNWRKSEKEDLTMEEVIYYVFEFFEQIDGLLFHTLSILF